MERGKAGGAPGADSPGREALDDHTLVQRARLELPRRTIAYQRLVERHADGVYRRAHRLLGSREDAEDVVQDVMLSVLRGLPGLRPEQPFSHWLSRVTTNACLLTLRRRGQRARRRDAFGREPRNGATHPPGDPMLREALARALEAFPEETRIAVVGRLLEERSYVELARELGLSESALKMRVSRACSALRERLAPEGGVDGG